MLFLCYLYITIQKTQARESQSLAFSHLVIDGMEKERQRISRELHDIVLPQVRGQDVAEEIRSICMELMPPDFTRLSLKDSFADICGKFSSKTGIECFCSIDKDIDFSTINAENQLHIYRITQEAFNNIEKHSQAKKVIFVAKSDDRGVDKKLLICISDDGVGFQDTGRQTENLGIKSMRQRAVIIGAKIDFISESGNGLMVRIEI